MSFNGSLADVLDKLRERHPDLILQHPQGEFIRWGMVQRLILEAHDAELNTLRAELQKERECVDDFLLVNQHLPECRAEYEMECKCMDRNYWNSDAVEERARERQKERTL